MNFVNAAIFARHSTRSQRHIAKCGRDFVDPQIAAFAERDVTAGDNVDGAVTLHIRAGSD